MPEAGAGAGSGDVWSPLDLSAARPIEAPLRDLARYIDPRHILQQGLQITESSALRRAAASTEEGNRSVAERLVSVLAERGLAYDRQPWSLRGTQRIRHPKQLDSEAATCVDLSVMFASACLAHDLAPVLAVSVGLSGGHVWVVVDLYRDLRIESPEPPMPQPRRWSSSQMRDDEGAGRYLSIDVSELAVGYAKGPSLSSGERQARAYTSGRALLGGEVTGDVFTIDVAVQLERGAPSYLEPESDDLPLIVRRLPPGPRFRAFGERASQLRELIEAQGAALVTGPSGVGKSLLALKAAEAADGGFGWFLSASSVNELVLNLAMTEALHVGDLFDPQSGDPNQLKAQAQMTLRRLANSRMPWVVVIDNADTDPTEIVRWLPQPDPKHGQKLIVTTTDVDRVSGDALGWSASGLFGITIALTPLSEELDYLPEALKVRGRPLLSEAWEALVHSSGDSLDQLGADAASLPQEFDGADVLWALTSRRLREPALRIAEMMAWAPPDAIKITMLAAASEASVPEAPGRDVADAVEGVYGSGLAQPWWPGTARMHRSIGRAIRSAQQRSEPVDALRVASAVVAAGLADPESLTTLAALLRTGDWTATQVVQRERSHLLHEIGRLIEPVQGVKPALELLTAAEELRREPDPDRQADLAHAEARQQFQHRDGDLDLALHKVEESLMYRRRALQEEAHRTERKRLELEVLRSRALRGLINVARAREVVGPDAVAQHHPDEATIAAATDLAQQGAAEVDDALELRRALLQPDIPPGGVHPDLLRGEFNQAHVAVSLAQHINRRVDDCRVLLERAYEHYDHVLEGRLKLRSQPLAQLAASHYGFALVEYLRAVLLHLPAETSLRHLRSAAAHLGTALAMREDIEPVDDSEVAKTVRLEALIALGRFAQVRRRQLRAERYEEELHELRRQAIRELELPW